VPSQKTAIIEDLFDQRWQADTGSLADPMVTLAQVAAAIAEHETALSPKNPANFFKDLIRNRRSANANWPQSVLDRGYTARQVTSRGNCFEFTPLQPGQALPFPRSGIHEPGPDVPLRQLQSASMPLASRRLGRSDEAWLIQVLARLHVRETHFALHPFRRFVQVDLLQTNVKLSRAEIDALFLAVEEVPGTETEQTREVLVTCEAKGLRDDLLEDQLIAQARAALGMSGVQQEVVFPTVAKAIGPSRVYVVQFAPIVRGDAAGLSSLQSESAAVYELVPSVPGVGK